MAGHGPPPKDPSTRARRNKAANGADFRIYEISPDVQPTLASLFGELNPVTREPWREWTVTAWDELNGFPSTRNHLQAQWRRLAIALAYEEAALLGLVAPAEARLRMAAHFIDPADLLRGRIQTVEAAKAEKSVPKPSPAKGKTSGKRPDPRHGLTAVS